MTSEMTGLQDTEHQAKTRTLLALWNLGGARCEVKKSELTKRVQRTHQKAGDYQGVFEELEKEGAIAITKKRVASISLTAQGLQMLSEGLRSPNFEYDAGVGAKTVNALLKWIRQMDGVASSAPASLKVAEQEIAPSVGEAIASYEDFKQVVLDVYDRLNRDYNLDDLVPIYRIRREISDRVSRSQFNEWMLEMQANDIFQLQGGEMPDITSDKAEDSITTELSGLRYYAKRLNS